jgi:hypothetical protein
VTTPFVPAYPAGYLRIIKTGAVDAIQQAFAISYPEQDAAGGVQSPHVSIDYPVEAGAYPGIWVDFEVTMLQTAGIDHTEMLEDGTVLTRWRFQGYAVFTIVALNSNECDGIYDQLVALTAFAAQSEVPSVFRQVIDANGLVNTTWSYDTVEGRGQSAAPGTPWGTTEIIYERGIGLKVIGEFVTSPAAPDYELVPLSKIIISAQETIGGQDVGDPYILTVPPGS